MFSHMFRKKQSNYQRSAWRSFLLVLVVCGVMWAFWQNSQNQLNLINSRFSVWDDPKVLTEYERTALQDMIGQFKSRYGIDVRMEILETPLHKPKSENPLIYLGINPSTSELMVSLPAWLRLGANFPEQVKETYMRPRLAEKEYAYALADGLRAIWDELAKTEELETSASEESSVE